MQTAARSAENERQYNDFQTLIVASNRRSASLTFRRMSDNRYSVQAS